MGSSAFNLPRTLVDFYIMIQYNYILSGQLVNNIKYDFSKYLSGYSLQVFQRLDRLPQYVFKTRHQISIMILTIFSLLFTLIFSCLNISVDISLSLKIIFFLRSIYNYFIFSSTLIRFSTLILCLRIQFETLNNEISSITSQHKMPISILVFIKFY